MEADANIRLQLGVAMPLVLDKHSHRIKTYQLVGVSHVNGLLLIKVLNNITSVDLQVQVSGPVQTMVAVFGTQRILLLTNVLEILLELTTLIRLMSSGLDIQLRPVEMFT